MDLAECRICPRQCGVDRTAGEKGLCRGGSVLKIASAFLHRWEEPFISGEKGSGTVFFSHCPLKCVFCQNYKISQRDQGKEYSLAGFVKICLDLQEQGAHNINLVSPTHYAPLLAEGLRLAKSRGLSLPIVYNTNGYEMVDTLRELEGLIDIYLPDLKYFAEEPALRYSGAPGYFQAASLAIREMYRQVGDPFFAENGLLQRGLVIRHLILPGLTEDSKKVLDWISRELPKEVYVSLMGQYTPVYRSSHYPEINRKLADTEYQEVIGYFLDLGLENGLIQDLSAADPGYIPEF